MMKKALVFAVVLLLAASPALARVDLTTLPERQGAELTIYNSADLTLVRENRDLTLKTGENALQFSWAGTLIDPTSLEMLPKKDAGRIHVQELAFLPRVRNLGLWSIESQVSGARPFELSYLTSGLSWRAFYMGTLSPDETRMELSGYVRVENRSGEDYPDARVRLVVGQVHLIDQVASLARRPYPYGRPQEGHELFGFADGVGAAVPESRMFKAALEAAPAPAMARPKRIEKKGVSEYFLYTIEGTETIPNQWAKRLPSFKAGEVPVKNLYKYEGERYGGSVVRFLSFKNDKAHKLGETPIPGGAIQVFRSLDAGGRLSYEGASNFKYIPVDEDVELSLGPAENVIVRPVLMNYKTDHYLFDKEGNINGWDEISTFEVTVKNTRPVAATVEITRNLPTPHWEVRDTDKAVAHTKVDSDTFRYTLTLAPGQTRTFGYVQTIRQGRRAY